MRNILDMVKGLKLSHLQEISLEKKIMLSFTGSLFVFFILIGLVITSRITENAALNAENATRATLVAKDNAILSLERSLKGKIKMLSKDTVLLNEPYDVAHTLRQFLKDNTEFSYMAFGRNDGEFVETPKNHRENAFDPRNTIWYKDAMAAGGSGMMIVTAPFQGLDGKCKVGFYSAATFYGDHFGVIGGAIDFSDLVKMSGEEKNLIILDNEDNIVFDSEKPDNLFKKLNKVNLDDLSLVGQKNEGMSKVFYEDKNMLAIVYKSDTTKLKYIKLIDYNEAVSAANNTKYILFAAFLLMLILSFALSKLLYKDIKNSFMNIEAQTEAIGEGRLDSIANLKETSDEVGRLSFAFGKMAGNVKSRLMTMETESQNLRALLKDISEKLESTKETLESLPENLNKVSVLYNGTFSKIKTVSDDTETLNDNIVKISDLQSKGKSDIMSLIQNTNDAIQSLKVERDNFAAKFKRDSEEYEVAFKNDAKNMNDALQKIADSASEISLMAFSAALEAAKGKDEKSKFAKIAEDIRKLADTVAKGANEGLKAIDKFAPKIAEPVFAADLSKELEAVANTAKRVESAINEMEPAISSLKTANKSANNAAKDTLASEKDAKTALQYATTAANEATQAINDAEDIADSAFK